MALLNLEILNFRCVENAQLQLDPRCTLIAGENAAGKTSVLEAIHVLSCGHSFRSGPQELLVRRGTDHFLTVGHVNDQGRTVVLGVQGSRESTEVRIGGRRARGFAELASVLPVQVIDPEVHRLLEDGPKNRRRFIDWGVFHVEPQFIQLWRRYQRALRQRNAALKTKLSRPGVSVWDSEIGSAGTLIASLRQRYVDGIQAIVAEIAGIFLDLPVRIEHRQGWNHDIALEQALDNAWLRDQRHNQTTVGPHRADLGIFVDGVPARERISRGQQKLLASAMLLAQIEYQASPHIEPVCLLLDDPAAELDVDNLKKLLTKISKISAQLVITSLDLSAVDRYLSGAAFHVKRGHVSPML